MKNEISAASRGAQASWRHQYSIKQSAWRQRVAKAAAAWQQRDASANSGARHGGDMASAWRQRGISHGIMAATARMASTRPQRNGESSGAAAAAP